MTANQINSLRVRIETALSDAEKKMEVMKSDLLSFSETQSGAFCDGLDHAKEENDLNTGFELLSQNRVTQARLRGALNRFDKGRYGRCIQCEEEISARRLEAHPAASHCFDCQSRQERQTGSALNPEILACWLPDEEGELRLTA